MAKPTFTNDQMRRVLERVALNRRMGEAAGFRRPAKATPVAGPLIYTMRVVALTAAGRIGFTLEDTSPDGVFNRVDPSLRIESVTVLGTRRA